jgi:hypothetical protein
VQDHGTVEIMRGCPNGCRFCHAGYFYRPQRVKPLAAICDEVESLVYEGGHREITLASLSSGDYPDLPELISSLNARWSARRVSFQLPSLKVNSFTLPLISQLAEVRKSGLTFAVETPVDEWQRLINKDVSFERTVAILEEARMCGFKQAKFYFMIGLPVPCTGIGEAEAIIDYFDRLFSRIHMQINVNVGTFVPKPHTPFQWSAQLGEDASLATINTIRAGLRRHKNIKLSYHSPFISQLEGVISRGDARVGGLILEAFRRGARLDAWEDHFDRELWRSVLRDAGWDVVGQCCGARDPNSKLPWDDISVRVSSAFLRSELEKAERLETTSACMENCTHSCGSCSEESMIVRNTIQPKVSEIPVSARISPIVHAGRFVFSFRKEGIAKYYQHLSIIEAFSRGLLMADIGAAFSEGFNPMPRLETVQPLPIAVGSDAEIASLIMTEKMETNDFMARMNDRLPEGLRILTARWYPIEAGIKQRSIGSLSWGSVFRIEDGPMGLLDGLRREFERIGRKPDDVTFRGKDILLLFPDSKTKEHNLIRILESCVDARPVQRAMNIVREACLADMGEGPISFFEAYDNVSSKPVV